MRSIYTALLAVTLMTACNTVPGPAAWNAVDMVPSQFMSTVDRELMGTALSLLQPRNDIMWWIDKKAVKLSVTAEGFRNGNTCKTVKIEIFSPAISEATKQKTNMMETTSLYCYDGIWRFTPERSKDKK